MKTSHRLLSLVCALLVTFGVLAGIDRLAALDPVPGLLAQSPAPRA